MLLFLVICLGGSAVGQSTPQADRRLPRMIVTAIHFPTQDLDFRILSPDFNVMIGGTPLPDVVFPQAVPIRQALSRSGGDLTFPCFATIEGNTSITRRMLLTSESCDVEGYIDKNYTDLGDYGLDIGIVRVMANQQTETRIPALDPFNVARYTFNYLNRLNETAYKAGELITDKAAFAKIMGNNKTTAAIVLGSMPYKAAVVSLDQSNCSKIYLDRLRRPGYPQELPTGAFCIFQGTKAIDAKVTPGVTRKIAVGLPCEDSLGSPILVDDFNHVLGFVYDTSCDNRLVLPMYPEVPKVALGVAFAYAFDWQLVTLPTYRMPGPAPPEYTGTVESFRPPTIMDPTFMMFGASPTTTAGRALLIPAAVVGLTAVWKTVENIP